jgi:hypothetical protein
MELEVSKMIIALGVFISKMPISACPYADKGLERKKMRRKKFGENLFFMRTLLGSPVEFLGQRLR